jgi:hypothetical protein
LILDEADGARQRGRVATLEACEHRLESHI